MLEKSELELETTNVARETSPAKEQGGCPEAGIHKEREGVALQVYQRRAKMTKVAPTVIQKELDEKI